LHAIMLYGITHSYFATRRLSLIYATTGTGTSTGTETGTSTGTETSTGSTGSTGTETTGSTGSTGSTGWPLPPGFCNSRSVSWSKPLIILGTNMTITNENPSIKIIQQFPAQRVFFQD
jgi:hypothetical protein